MEMDVAADIRRARPRRRSTSIATAWPARSGGCRSRCSAWTRSRASRWPIISAARCSSPISCATSTRTPRIGRLYLPREFLIAAGIAVDRSRRGDRRSAHRRGLPRRSRRWRTSIIARPTRSWPRDPRAASAAPRLMGAVYGAILRADGSRRLGRRRARRVSLGKARAALDRAAPRPVRMTRGKAYVIGAGLAGPVRRRRAWRRRGVAVELIEAAAAGGRALPLLFRRPARPDHRQRQSPGAVGQPARRIDYLRAIGAEDRAGRAGPGRVRLRRPAQRRALDASRPTRGRCPGGCSTRRAGCRAPAPPTIWRLAGLLLRRRGPARRRGDRVRGRGLGPADAARSCWRR